MNDRKLVRRLFVVVAIKLVFLTALWWLFFRGQAVQVDTQNALPNATSLTLSPQSKEPPHAQ